MAMTNELDLLKLDMVRSIAQSQRALASMMTSVASMASNSPRIAKQIAANIELLIRYERILLAKINLLLHDDSTPRQPSSSRTVAAKFGRPWLSNQVKSGK